MELPWEQLAARFRADVEALTGAAPQRLHLAVSGGPDSLALLLLAQRAWPGRIAAATVDHGLRAEAAAEAEAVAALCRRLAVAHEVLTGRVAAGASLQAQARTLRYRLLGDWMRGDGGRWLITAHHLDDQAETVLMRLARGAGTAGLSGIRPRRPLEGGGMLVRPLLGWRRAELAAIVAAAGLEAADDPANRCNAHDRTRFRRLLGEAGELDPERIAAASAHLADAEAALAWAAEAAWRRCAHIEGAAVEIDVADLPREVRRRLLVRAIDAVRGAAGLEGAWRRDGAAALLDRLGAGGTGTIAGVKAQGGPTWRLTPAPPRR